MTYPQLTPFPKAPAVRRMKPKRNHGAGQYVATGIDACQTPPRALAPLLPFIPRQWTIWEPASGEGLLVDALRTAGLMVIESDIITGQDFFEYQPDQAWDCLITNPPYSRKYPWLARCYELGKPFALLLPVETLGAKTAQCLFSQHGIAVLLIHGRVNFKMPRVGFEGSNAQFPVAWFTWGIDIGGELVFEVTS